MYGLVRAVLGFSVNKIYHNKVKSNFFLHLGGRWKQGFKSRQNIKWTQVIARTSNELRIYAKLQFYEKIVLQKQNANQVYEKTYILKKEIHCRNKWFIY